MIKSLIIVLSLFIWVLMLSNCKHTDSLEYLMLSHIYLYEGDKCFIKNDICKAMIPGNCKSYLTENTRRDTRGDCKACQQYLEDCIIRVDRKWQQVKQQHNW